MRGTVVKTTIGNDLIFYYGPFQKSQQNIVFESSLVRSRDEAYKRLRRRNLIVTDL